MALSEIDQAVKKHADDLIHAIKGVSARLSQMESRTRNLESLVDGLKTSVESNHGSTEGKLRQLENVLREVFRLLAAFTRTPMITTERNNNVIGMLSSLDSEFRYR